MNEQALLATAFRFCLGAHEHQIDKSGAPYFLHPVRMALRTENIEEQIVCLLHDVLKDRPDLENALTEEFGGDIFHSVWILTRAPGASYEEYIQRVLNYQITRRVKILDLEDNLAWERLAKLPEGVTVPVQRYAQALRRLQQGVG